MANFLVWASHKSILSICIRNTVATIRTKREWGSDVTTESFEDLVSSVMVDILLRE